MSKRPRRPCTSCAVNMSTVASGLCRSCSSLLRAGEIRPCVECSLSPAAKDEDKCTGCILAIKDDNNVRGLQESNYDLDDHGHWVAGKLGIQRWVPGPPPTMPKPLRRPRARRAARRPVEAKAKARAKPLPTTNVERQFTDDECRDGRALYVQGDRSMETLARNREYGRVMKAARRQSTNTRPRKVA